MLRIQLSLGDAITRDVFATWRKNFDHYLGSSDQTFVGDDLFAAWMTIENEIGNHATVLAENQTGRGDYSSDRIPCQIIPKVGEEISRHNLVRKTGCAGPKEFSFYDLVTIP